MKKPLCLFLLGITLHSLSYAQSIGLKTNIVHWAAGGTPNIGAAFILDQHYTVDIGGGYNWFAFSDSQKAKHWIVQPEVRYWLQKSLNGHFFGLHALVGEYNVGGIDIPIGRLKDWKENRYEGFGVGAGLSYGYQWPISHSLSLEFSVGLGYAYLEYDKYPCAKCGEKIKSDTNHYLGVTKTAISLIYIIK